MSQYSYVHVRNNQPQNCNTERECVHAYRKYVALQIEKNHTCGNPVVKRFLAFYKCQMDFILAFPILLAMLLRVSTLASRIAQFFIVRKIFRNISGWSEPLKYMALVLVIGLVSLLNTHGN